MYIRRLYTWKAPGDRSRHQVDYILVKHRFRNSVKDVQTLPGADIDSDHNLLVANICTRLKRIIRFQKRRPQWDLEKFYTQAQRVRDTLEGKLFNRMWQWECKSKVEQYKGMCARYSQCSGWESHEESKKTIDYTGNDQYNGRKKEMDECQH